MELYEEIIIQLLKEHPESFLRRESNASFANLFEHTCYQTLQKIKAIIEDDSLDDPDCFWKIEKIVNAFEDIGSTGGNRHDFC